MSGAFITIALSSETTGAAFTSHPNPTENPMTARRQFIQWIPAAGLALMAARTAQAEMVGEKDANAVALGYVADATKADKAKFKTYAAGQKCSNCQLYQGKATDAVGGCPLFGAKQVAGPGWCSAYAKKP
jgi:hypothetical protein